MTAQTDMVAMTQRHRWVKALHRVHAGVTVATITTLVVLNLSGVLDGGPALCLVLTIEVPLLVVFLVLTLLRLRYLRNVPGGGDRGVLDRMAAEEPLLRPVVSELRCYHSLVLALTGRRRVPPGATPFGYTKGAVTVPTAIVTVCLVETVVVHLVVPWQWLRIILLVFSIWGVLLLAGVFASRVVHPHLVTAYSLHLRWGPRTVLSTPLTNVLSAGRHSNHAHSQPCADGERLVLTQFQSTNVVLHFAEQVVTDAPVPDKEKPAGFRAKEVQLYVDDPDAFLRAVTPLPDEVSA